MTRNAFLITALLGLIALGFVAVSASAVKESDDIIKAGTAVAAKQPSLLALMSDVHRKLLRTYSITAEKNGKKIKIIKKKKDDDDDDDNDDDDCDEDDCDCDDCDDDDCDCDCDDDDCKCDDCDDDDDDDDDDDKKHKHRIVLHKKWRSYCKWVWWC